MALPVLLRTVASTTRSVPEAILAGSRTLPSMPT